MFYPTRFGSGQSNSDIARNHRDPDLSYRIGIMLAATSDPRERQVLRRQLQGA